MKAHRIEETLDRGGELSVFAESDRTPPHSSPGVVITQGLALVARDLLSPRTRASCGIRFPEYCYYYFIFKQTRVGM